MKKTLVKIMGVNFIVGLCILVLFPMRVGAQWLQAGISGYDSVFCLLANGSNLFAGTDSGLYVSANNGSNWVKVDSGLPQSGVFALAASGANMFAGTDNGIYRSIDSGLSWQGVLTGNTHILALAMTGTVVIASSTTSGCYVTSNNGLYWKSANAGLPGTEVLSFFINGTNVFAGTQNGIYLSKDSGASWSADTVGLAYPPLGFYPWVYSFAVIGTNIFAGTSFGVYLRSDSDSSWSRVISGLKPPYRAFALLASGSNIFAATDSGVFLSSNSGASWSSADTGLPYGIHINTLVISGGYLFAGTAGGGVWRRPLSEMIAVKYTALKPKNAIALNVDNNNILRYVLPSQAFVSLKIFDIRGRLMVSAINGIEPAGVYTLPLAKERFSSGSYIVDFSAGDYKSQKRVALIR